MSYLVTVISFIYYITNKGQCDSQVLQMRQALKRIFINGLKSVGCKQAAKQISKSFQSHTHL